MKTLHSIILVMGIAVLVIGNSHLSFAQIDLGGSRTYYLIDSPLKQFKSGIISKDVKCPDGHTLIIKSESSFPACVKPNTAVLLILRGWAIESPNHILVYHVKSNSTAQIFVEYNPQYVNEPTSLHPRIYDGKTPYQIPPSKISATVNPDSIQGVTNSTVTYTITTNATRGVYWLSVDMCQFIPIAVDVDRSQITGSDLQFIMSGWRCPSSLLHYHVVSVSNVTVEYRED